MAVAVKRQAQAIETSLERRGGARQRLLMRVAKLRCHSGEYPCVMHDVSETGTRLRLFGAHPPDTHMYLELANGDLYALERRWTDGEFAGFRFSSPIDVDELIHEPGKGVRRPVRLRMAVAVDAIAAGVRHRVKLVDLSRQGACIGSDVQLPVGSPVRIELPGHAPRFGHVCWRRHNRHGVAFQETFALDRLAEIALALQPFDGVSAWADPASRAWRA